MTNEDKLKKICMPFKTQVKKRANGALKYDYIVPGGPYMEQWDWDGFFVGISLVYDAGSEAIYLRNWALNYLNHTNPKTGFTPGLLSPSGRDRRLHHVKPFLAQGVHFASKSLDGWEWVREYYPLLKKSIAYRERYMWNNEYDMGVWYDGMESGADNNVAVYGYPKKTIIGADLNTFLQREYKAMSAIAHKLNYKKDEQYYRAKAQAMKKKINKYLWSEEDASYFNLDAKNKTLIKRVTYSNVIPLWGGLADKQRGRKMIKKYMLDPRKLWGPFGLRTLAKDDPKYNNQSAIKPCSNWQGPVWPIANFFYMHALLNYGFKKEAIEVAEKIIRNCLKDIKHTGGMHENYNAENGKAICAPNFVSWNLLATQMLTDAKIGYNPLAF